MASNTGDSQEVLLLTDHDGNWYAVPREVVDRHRATTEQKAEIEQILGNDVQGFHMASESAQASTFARFTFLPRGVIRR